MAEEIREDLQPMTMAWVEGLRRKRKSMRYGGDNKHFFSELEIVLICQTEYPNRKWEKLEEDEFIHGDVWIQRIGEFHHKHRVHKFELIYVGTQGLAISQHCHSKPVNKGRQEKKVKEWYVWPDGRMTFCNKDKSHKLVNGYGRPIYVLSIKVMSSSNR